MANFEPPPTHTDPVSQDEATGAWRFNPHWLKWFVDLANALGDAGVVGGAIDHATLQNLTTGDPHTQYQKESEKDAASGYAGLNSASRTTKGVVTTDDLIVNLATKGLVLKDTQGTPHYWRVTVDNTGTLVVTDLGTSLP